METFLIPEADESAQMYVGDAAELASRVYHEQTQVTIEPVAIELFHSNPDGQAGWRLKCANIYDQQVTYFYSHTDFTNWLVGQN